MIDQPASQPALPDAPPAAQITLRNLNFPWRALDAQGVPSEFLVASNSVQLALAMLTGQHNGVPALLDVDDNGHLGFNILEIAGQALQLGQQAEAASLPVTIARDQGPPPGYDDTDFVSGAVGVTQLLQIGGFVGEVIHLGLLVVKFENVNAAAAGAADFTITDGATVKFRHHMAAGAAPGSQDTLTLVGTRFKNLLGSSPFILAFDSCPAGFAESINAGWDLRSTY